MKLTKLLITAALCVSLGASMTFAQSRSTEGVSRQIQAIQNMLKSFADDVRPRLTDLETDVSGLVERENERTTCINISGDPSIYWPTHPEADSATGCVSHEELTSETTVAGGCTNRTVSWATSYNTCSAMAPPTPEGVNVTVTKSIPFCDQGYTGTATFQCVDGNFVLQSGSCAYQNNFGECR